MKKLLTAMFVALLLAGCGEEIPTTGKEAKNGNLREVNINMISELFSAQEQVPRGHTDALQEPHGQRAARGHP